MLYRISNFSRIDGVNKEILGISDLLLGEEIAARGGVEDEGLEVICYGLLGGKLNIEH